MSDLNTDIAATEEALEAAKEAEEALKKQHEDTLASIAMSITGKLSDRMGRKKVKEAQMLESMRLFLGSLANRYYSDSAEGFFSEKETVRKRPEYNIVKNKCQIAVAQTIAYQFAAGDKNWSLRAPQVTDMDDQDLRQYIEQNTRNGQPPEPPSREQVAEYKASLMERAIEYHLTNSNYGHEARKAMTNRVILGTGILKGPKNAGKMKKVYKKGQTSDGQPIRIPTYIHETVPCIYSVNPWYFFPDDSVTEFKYAEDAIEVHLKNKSDLREFLKHPGFFQDQVAEILKEDPKSIVNCPFDDPAYLTQGLGSAKDKYLVIEYHGPLTANDLSILGVQSTIDTEAEALYCEVWVVNDRVIRLDVSNSDGSYCLPYCMCVWDPDPATPFGFGIPMDVQDGQRIVNETLKMILDNAGNSAGPQVIVDTTLVKPAEGGLEITPFKVWYSDDAFGNDLSKAIIFFTPPNQFEDLNNLLQLARSMADEQASIPAIMSGIQNPTGAGDSATGLAIANHNAQSPIFFKSEEWDDNITSPLIKAMYDWEMEYNPDDSIKGTYEIDVRTSTSYLRNSLQQQKLERLSMEVSQGSPIGEHVNMDQLAVARLSNMGLPSRGIVKDPIQLATERANRPPPPPDPNMIKAEAEKMKAENDKERIALENRKLDDDATIKMREAEMKFQSQMATDETRKIEAQAQVMKAQFDFQAAMAQLAARDEESRMKIVAQLQDSELTRQSQKFLAGMDMALKVEDQKLKKEELQVKRKQGSGI
jgi:hypothetical protein